MAAMVSSKAATPDIRRKGARGTEAPSAKASSEPKAAVMGEPIVFAERPISSRTKVSSARFGLARRRSTMKFASARDRPLDS